MAASGLWITLYRAVHDPAALARYAELALPAISAGGGVFIARGVAAHAFEAGIVGRTVVIRFPSVEAALATYHSPAYAAALAALGSGAERDLRIIEACA